MFDPFCPPQARHILPWETCHNKEEHLLKVVQNQAIPCTRVAVQMLCGAYAAYKSSRLREKQDALWNERPRCGSILDCLVHYTHCHPSTALALFRKVPNKHGFSNLKQAHPRIR